MKIIDDRGRILGKLNIIDFVFIILLLSVIPVFFYGNMLSASKKPAEQSYKKVQVEVKFLKVMPELASVMKEGDVDNDSAGKPAGVLKKILVNKNSELVALGKSDQVVMVEDPTVRDIRASFELNCIVNNGVLDFEGYSVKIGNMISFTTNLYSIQGVVVRIESE